MKCARALARLIALCAAGVPVAHAQTYGDDVFQPSMGQHRKDVILIPTPDALVTAMLAASSDVDADHTLRSAQVTVADRQFKGELSLHGRRSAITGARRERT